MSSDIKPPHKVGRKYRLGKRLGSGSFGEVYHGTDVTSGKSYLLLALQLLFLSSVDILILLA